MHGTQIFSGSFARLTMYGPALERMQETREKDCITIKRHLSDSGCRRSQRFALTGANMRGDSQPRAAPHAASPRGSNSSDVYSKVGLDLPAAHGQRGIRCRSISRGHVDTAMKRWKGCCALQTPVTGRHRPQARIRNESFEWPESIAAREKGHALQRRCSVVRTQKRRVVGCRTSRPKYASQGMQRPSPIRSIPPLVRCNTTRRRRPKGRWARVLLETSGICAPTE